MRKYLVAAVLAAAVAVLATAAFGSTKSPARTSSAGAATVTCGKTRTIGLAAPFTGPAADIGNQQVRWAKYYVKRWNAQKANKNKQIKVVPGDTQLGVTTPRSPSGSRSRSPRTRSCSASSAPPAARRSSRPRPAYKGGGLGFVSGSATRTTLTDGHTDGNRRGYFFRTVPSDAAQAPGSRQLDDQEAEVEAGLHHRRPGDLLAGPGRRGAEDPQGPRRRPSPATRSARPTRTSRPRSRRSRATPRASTSRGSSPRRLRPSGSS